MTERMPLVLIPGLLCDGALWRHQVDHLGDIAAITVADMTLQDTIADMAETVLAAAPPRFALAGLSLGGYVALDVMRRAPGRVPRLALLDTSARADTEEQTRRRRDLAALAERGRFKGVTPRLLPMLIHPDRLEDAMLVGEVTAMAERVGKNAFLRQQKAVMGRSDSRDHLGRIGAETLVICGRDDALTPLDLSREIAGAVPGARLVVIEDCGHLSTMERPQAVTALFRYWL